MVIDHGTIRFMSAEATLAISRFKATCLAVLERVRRTGRPVTVTRFGEPMARVVPPAPARGKRRVLGAYADRGEILGDIVSPVLPLEAWDVLRK
jgi:prevent-host-death family protein